MPPYQEEPSHILIQERIDKTVSSPCQYQDPAFQEFIENSLQEEITVDTAVQIALLNNPIVRAHMENIGIAYADLEQAGLLQNPTVGGMIRFPNKSYATLNTEFSIVQNILDLLLIPLKKEIAWAELEKTYLETAQAILDIAFEVQGIFYTLQTEQNKVEYLQTILDCNEAALALAQAQNKVGNITPLQYQVYQNSYLQAQLDLANNKANLIRLQEKLKSLLGIKPFLCLKIQKQIPCPQVQEAPLEIFEEITLEQRFDLQIAKWNIQQLAATYNMHPWWAYTALAVGLSSEKDPEGIVSTGPTLSLELPIFNDGQPTRDRINAQFRQAIDNFNTLEILALAQIRSAYQRLDVSREILSNYQEQLLPLQKQTLDLSEVYYNSMALSIYHLLEAKRQQLIAQINYNDALREYYLCKIEIERAISGKPTLALAAYNEEAACIP